ITNDNNSANFSAGEEIEKRLERRKILGDWNASRDQLGCFGHVVQLGTVDFMSEVTQVGLVASKQAIWDYDP
ncbi:hypothetical protein OH76DRAFT_1318913, partial [Lentinus brumalis]